MAAVVHRRHSEQQPVGNVIDQNKDSLGADIAETQSECLPAPRIIHMYPQKLAGGGGEGNFFLAHFIINWKGIVCFTIRMHV